MNLKIKDIVMLTGVSEKTVNKWIEEHSIPFYKLNGQYRFSEAEINEWIISNKLDKNLNISDKLIELSAAKKQVKISEILQRGGIHYNINGDTVKDVIINAIDLLSIPDEITKDDLVESLLERENMMPTAMGHGIAIPHPRNPIITEFEHESLSICFLKNEVDYKAIDGNFVHTIFIVLSATPKRHLEILSKISYLNQQKEFYDLIKGRAAEKEIMDYITKIEKSWIKE